MSFNPNTIGVYKNSRGGVNLTTKSFCLSAEKEKLNKTFYFEILGLRWKLGVRVVNGEKKYERLKCFLVGLL